MKVHVPHTSITCTTLVDLLLLRAQSEQRHPAYTFLTFGHNEETEERSFTYADLDHEARLIAACLQGLQAKGKRALLMYQPGLEYIAAFFGCLYAGVVAVPVYPPRPNMSLSRLEAVAENAQATFVLTSSSLYTKLDGILQHVPLLKALTWIPSDTLVEDQATAWRHPNIKSDDLALLQYTSGSTGLPKGVALTHANLLSNSLLIHEAFETDTSSQGVIWLPLYHDMGLIGGILQGLYCGGTATLMSPVAFLERPLRWLQTLTRTKATISGGPNFAYDLCVRKIPPEQQATLDLSHWELAFCGAEPCRPETMKRFAETFASCGFRREAFYPCYGLAEASLMVSGSKKNEGPVMRSFQATSLEQSQVVDASTKHTRTLVSCGRILAHQRVLIVDPQQFTECQPDRVGEIWIAGPSVAQGYWNRPEETREAFQAYVYDTGEGPFLRTGDLGFFKDGELFITSRLKDLIIIRGRNHYPQDIEITAEQSHPALRQGSGAAFAVEIDDEEKLVIVYEIDRQYRHVNIQELAKTVRQAVNEQHELQTYAVVFVKMGSIPKTSSGKIQRYACRNQFLDGTLHILGQSILDESYVTKGIETLSPEELLTADQSKREQILETYLCHQVARVLHIPSLDVDPLSPLSTLGLDSLMSIELKNDIEMSLNIQLPMEVFLYSNSIKQLAIKVLSLLDASAPPLPEALTVPQEDRAHAPLAFNQQALWFLHRLAPESAAYTIAHAVYVHGDINLAALQSAFQAMIDRHASLRTLFPAYRGKPVQEVQEQREVHFQVQDASGWNEGMIKAYLHEKAHRPFDLVHGPLIEVKLLTRSTHEHILILVADHIIIDLWSLAVMVRELEILYTAARANQESPLPPLAAQYTDYARWQHEMVQGPEGEKHWLYWQKQLAGELPVLDLPITRPRPAVQTYHGSSQALALNAPLSRALRSLAKSEKTTLYTVLLALFQVLLYRYTCQEDIVIGSPTAGRDKAAWANVVGYFVNSIPLRAHLSDQYSFKDVLSQARQTVIDALVHQGYPFTLLVERLQPPRDPSRPPIFQVMFAFQTISASTELAAFALEKRGTHMKFADLDIEILPIEQQATPFDLTLMMAETDETISAVLQYNTDVFDAAMIERMSDHLQTLANSVVTAPEEPIVHLNLLTEAEHHQLLVTWNETQRVYPDKHCLHTLFEAHVARTPEAPAVVYKDDVLSYMELNRRANQVAHYLQECGVGPETCVALYMERSLDLIIGLLGILKARGAYVALDPMYPRERLTFMLEDAHVIALLTQERLLGSLPRSEVQLLCLDTDESLKQKATVNLQHHVFASNLAYVLYTSGSTGVPKGVAVSHQGVVNMLADCDHRKPLLPGSSFSLWTSINFDVSVYEIFSAFSNGGALHIVPDELRSHSTSFFTWLQYQGIQSAYIPPFMLPDLHDWLETETRSLSLQRLLVGVEPIQEQLLVALAHHIPGLHIINGYGPTEATICASLYSVLSQPVEQRNTPIGRPVQNMHIYLLDDSMQLVPIGVPGQLYIGGVGLARGYIYRPGLTAESFLPDPFNDRVGARLYKTGDMARYLEDGNIEFLGRVDRQVKLRGYRVELAEIEAVLGQHVAVQQVAVVDRENESGQKQIVAYIVVSPEMPVPEPGDLRAFMKTKLPAYMLPSTYMFLDAMPLTPNDKLDRKALPVPERTVPLDNASFVAPRTATEKTLATIWQEVLGLEQVGIYDNFFDRGGHSLLATQIISRACDTFNVDLPLHRLFELASIADLSQAIEQAQASDNTMQKAQIKLADREQRRVKLSSLQKKSKKPINKYKR